MPVLVNLKFLKIRFFSYTNLIFHRIVSFISACPSLETIGLEFTVLEVIIQFYYLGYERVGYSVPLTYSASHAWSSCFVFETTN